MVDKMVSAMKEVKPVGQRMTLSERIISRSKEIGEESWLPDSFFYLLQAEETLGKRIKVAKIWQINSLLLAQGDVREEIRRLLGILHCWEFKKDPDIMHTIEEWCVVYGVDQDNPGLSRWWCDREAGSAEYSEILDNSPNTFAGMWEVWGTFGNPETTEDFRSWGIADPNDPERGKDDLDLEEDWDHRKEVARQREEVKSPLDEQINNAWKSFISRTCTKGSLMVKLQGITQEAGKATQREILRGKGQAANGSKPKTGVGKSQLAKQGLNYTRYAMVCNRCVAGAIEALDPFYREHFSPPTWFVSDKTGMTDEEKKLAKEVESEGYKLAREQASAMTSEFQNFLHSRFPKKGWVEVKFNSLKIIRICIFDLRIVPSAVYENRASREDALNSSIPYTFWEAIGGSTEGHTDCPLCDGGLLNDDAVCPVCQGFGEGDAAELEQRFYAMRQENEWVELAKRQVQPKAQIKRLTKTTVKKVLPKLIEEKLRAEESAAFQGEVRASHRITREKKGYKGPGRRIDYYLDDIQVVVYRNR